MKKLLLLSAAIVIASSLSAQFYAGFGAGYSMGASKRANGVQYDSEATQTNIYGSYGQGLNLNLKLGYMFNDNIGFELGTSYLLGATQTKHDASTSIGDPAGYMIPAGTVKATSNGLRLSPQLLLKTESGLYSRVGIIIPVMGKTVVEYDLNVALNTQLTATEEYHGSFSMGIIGAIGYSYAFADNMDLFAELEYIGMSIKSGTAEYTKYEMNGTDQLEKMTTSAKETEFVDEVKATDNTSTDEPTKELRQEAPFSSFGLNIGIVMKF